MRKLIVSSVARPRIDYVQQYNVVVSECFKLREDVQRLQYPKATVLPDSPPYSTGSPSSGSPTFASKLATGLDRKGLNDAAVADPTSLLISPLPQFTGRMLPLSELKFADLSEAVAENTPVKPNKEKEPEVQMVADDAPCRAAGHPFSCHCIHFSVFSDEASNPRTPPSQASPAREQVNAEDSAPASHEDSSSRSRSGSFTRSQSRSPRHRSKKSSGKSSPPMPSPDAAQLAGLSQNQDPDTLRHRLHDILSTPLSISLPNFPVDHFPPTLAREPRQREESPPKLPSRPPSRSGTSPVHRAQRSSPKSSQPVDCHNLPSDVHPPLPPLTFIPPAPRLSSASAAAQALANAQKADKERQRMEKEQRRQERERNRAERERLRSEAKGASHQAPLSTSTVTTVPTTHHNGNPATLGVYSSTSGSASLSRHGSINRPGSTAPLPIYREVNSASTQHQRYGKPLGPSMAASMAASMTTSASSTRLYA